MTLLSTYRAAWGINGQVSCRRILAPSAALLTIVSEWMQHSRGGLHKVKCRICKKEINYQGYKNHIKTQHPDEDCGDLNAYNQPSLFGQGRLKRKNQIDEVEEEREEEEEE